MKFKQEEGFTLVELMVAVLIIGILAAIAYPSYAQFVRKGHRADAQAALVELAQQMERYYTTNNTYVGAILSADVTDRVGVRYTIDFSIRNAQEYVLQAVPKSIQAADACGTLTLSHTGVRSPAAAGCWR